MDDFFSNLGNSASLSIPVKSSNGLLVSLFFLSDDQLAILGDSLASLAFRSTFASSFGILVFDTSKMVGKTSTRDNRVSEVVLGLIIPGHLTINGRRSPCSCTVSYTHLTLPTSDLV